VSTFGRRLASSRSIASPILLFGVDAPAVMPRRNAPSGSQPADSVSGASAARSALCRIVPAAGHALMDDNLDGFVAAIAG